MTDNSDIYVQCPWCLEQCNTTTHRPVKATPCGCIGCIECLRNELAPRECDERRKTECMKCHNMITHINFEGLTKAYTAPTKTGDVDFEAEYEKLKKRLTDYEAEAAKKGRGRGNAMETVKFKEEIDALKARVQELEDPMGLRRMDTEEDMISLLPKIDFEQWICCVCNSFYDMEDHRPRIVSKCSKDSPNKYAQGVAPVEVLSCNHTVCERCALRILQAGDSCPMCRSHVMAFAPDIATMREMTVLGQGIFAQMTRLINHKQDEADKAIKSENSMRVSLAPMRERTQAAERAVDTVQRNLRDLKVQMSTLTLDAQRTRDSNNLLRDSVREQSAMNQMLFEELIALRIRCVEEGILTRDQMGMHAIRDNAMGFRGVAVSVSSLEKKKQKLYYTMSPGDMTHEFEQSIQKVNRFEKEASDLKRKRDEEGLPGRDELEESYMELEDDQVLVQRGTWLYDFILSRKQTTESVFDAPAMSDETGEAMIETTYRCIRKETLDSALGAYSRMMAEKKKLRRKRKQEEEERREKETKNEDEDSTYLRIAKMVYYVVLMTDLQMDPHREDGTGYFVQHMRRIREEIEDVVSKESNGITCIERARLLDIRRWILDDLVGIESAGDYPCKVSMGLELHLLLVIGRESNLVLIGEDDICSDSKFAELHAKYLKLVVASKSCPNHKKTALFESAARLGVAMALLRDERALKRFDANAKFIELLDTCDPVKNCYKSVAYAYCPLDGEFILEAMRSFALALFHAESLNRDYARDVYNVALANIHIYGSKFGRDFPERIDIDATTYILNKKDEVWYHNPSTPIWFSSRFVLQPQDDLAAQELRRARRLSNIRLSGMGRSYEFPEMAFIGHHPVRMGSAVSSPSGQSHYTHGGNAFIFDSNNVFSPGEDEEPTGPGVILRDISELDEEDDEAEFPQSPVAPMARGSLSQRVAEDVFDGDAMDEDEYEDSDS